MSGARPQAVRCAIYTRKSSDEGLEQSFNSLDAQREACAAYILSQASEGWSALPEVYDDGGLSGGTLERPALQRLLAEVAGGRVDIIVVYKVDRLTRSLFDFAKLVETFDKSGTSFVSVTQSFNTTTSMGRLTLNMLLSFAQFEREVTAERIRDKIAASKARGMWMGGTPPLGYAPDGRTLRIVKEHAALLRHIFDRYLALGTVSRLAEELQQQAIALPVRQRISGSTIGGGWFSRGQLYKILSNPIYIGRIPHAAKSYPGLHQPIIDEATFAAVQTKLADNLQGSRTRVRAASPSLLAGRIVDADGEPLIATHATKGATRYRYYISRGLNDGTGGIGMRLPAREIETLVIGRVAQLLADPVEMIATAWLDVPASQIEELHWRCKELEAQLKQRRSPALLAIISEVRVGTGEVTVACDAASLAAALDANLHEDAPASVQLTAGARLTRTGRALRLVQGNGAPTAATPNASLVRLLVKARRWWRMLREGELDVTTLAAQENVQPAYVTRVVRLAFLSPQVIEAALTGKLQTNIDVGALTLAGPFPGCWRAQAAAMLPG